MLLKKPPDAMVYSSSKAALNTLTVKFPARPLGRGSAGFAGGVRRAERLRRVVSSCGQDIVEGVGGLAGQLLDGVSHLGGIAVGTGAAVLREE